MRLKHVRLLRWQFAVPGSEAGHPPIGDSVARSSGVARLIGDSVARSSGVARLISISIDTAAVVIRNRC